MRPSSTTELFKNFAHVPTVRLIILLYGICLFAAQDQFSRAWFLWFWLYCFLCLWSIFLFLFFKAAVHDRFYYELFVFELIALIASIYSSRTTVRDKRWRREGSDYYCNLILLFGKHTVISIRLIWLLGIAFSNYGIVGLLIILKVINIYAERKISIIQAII